MWCKCYKFIFYTYVQYVLIFSIWSVFISACKYSTYLLYVKSVQYVNFSRNRSSNYLEILLTLDIIYSFGSMWNKMFSYWYLVHYIGILHSTRTTCTYVLYMELRTLIFVLLGSIDLHISVRICIPVTFSYFLAAYFTTAVYVKCTL